MDDSLVLESDSLGNDENIVFVIWALVQIRDIFKCLEILLDPLVLLEYDHLAAISDVQEEVTDFTSGEATSCAEKQSIILTSFRMADEVPIFIQIVNNNAHVDVV